MEWVPEGGGEIVMVLKRIVLGVVLFAAPGFAAAQEPLPNLANEPDPAGQGAQVDAEGIVPGEIVFGAGIDEITRRIYPLCESMALRVAEPPGIRTSRSSHVSIDCFGFSYRGVRRHMELIFGDNQLDLVWIDLLSDEIDALLVDVETRHGAPSHKQPNLTAFLEAGICIIPSQSRLLLLSERMKEPYHMFFSERPSI